MNMLDKARNDLHELDRHLAKMRAHAGLLQAENSLADKLLDQEWPDEPSALEITMEQDILKNPTQDLHDMLESTQTDLFKAADQRKKARELQRRLEDVISESAALLAEMEN